MDPNTQQPQEAAASENAQRSLTLGERRVRVYFNPNENPAVSQIKGTAAVLIDLCEEMKSSTESNSEKVRLIALAQTSFEEAAMWAVKAATS